MSERPTVARRDGLIVLTLHEREVQVLQWVFTDLGRMLADGSSVDAVTQRLYPRRTSTPPRRRPKPSGRTSRTTRSPSPASRP